MSMSIHGLTYSFMNNFLLLVAMFQLIFITVLLRLVMTLLTRHLMAHRTELLLQNLVTQLSGDGLAFLAVRKLLHWLGLHLGFHITFLDGDRVTFLILDWVGNNNRQFLTDLLHLGLALLLMHGLGNVLALLHRLLVALMLLMTMFIMMLGTV